MKMAMRQDEPVSVDIRSTLADGLAVPTVGYNAYRTAKPFIDKLVSISRVPLKVTLRNSIIQIKYIIIFMNSYFSLIRAKITFAHSLINHILPVVFLYITLT